MSNAPEDHSDDVEAIASACSEVEMVIAPRVRDLGGGFQVRRILPFHRKRMVGPFIFFDHFGPVQYRPGEGFDVRPHPHIGLSTVTYLFEGAIRHRDTVGSDLVIRPGAVNWMTAGKGIVHSERTPPEERANGQSLHGIQTWLALPRGQEEIDPAFEHHAKDTLPVIEKGGARLQLIAGKAWGAESPVRFPHPIWYLAADAPTGAEFTIEADAAIDRAVYLAEGSLSAGTHEIEPGQMAVLKQGCDVTIKAGAHTRFMLAGGAPMPERRFIEWNLVASEPGLIDQARKDWQASIENAFEGTRFALPEGEEEFIPLPSRD